jgi:hypothetical protein
MTWCPDCDEIKTIADFARTKAWSSGIHSYCKPWHNKRGRETVQRLHSSTREYPLHRIGQKEFDALLAGQGGVCAICGAPDPQHVDHDHVFGNVRGVLRFNCTDVQNLSKAISYLRGTTWQRVLIHPGVYRLCSPRR